MGDLFDFSSPWFWVSIAFKFIYLLMWTLVVHEILGSSLSSKIVSFSMIAVFSIVDFAIFVMAVQNQPINDWGFWTTIFASTLTFYTSLLTMIISLFAAIKQGFMTLKCVRSFLPVMLMHVLIELSFALAYGSIPAICLTILSVILALLKRLIIPSDPKPKAKTE